MATYSVHMGNVQEVAAEMGAIAKYIQGLLDDLEQQTAKSLAEWETSARDAYNAAKLQWDNAATDMCLQADNAQATLSSITDNYALAEYHGLGLWGQ